MGRIKERYSRMARYCRMTRRHDVRLPQDESKRAEAEKLDGSYLLKTDRADLSADEA